MNQTQCIVENCENEAIAVYCFAHQPEINDEGDRTAQDYADGPPLTEEQSEMESHLHP